MHGFKIKMWKRGDMSWAAGLAVLEMTAGCVPGGQARAAERPNILLVVADDLGYGDVGFNGCRDIPTPALDRLAAEGVIFSNGHVAGAVCGPSRAGMLTGRYPERIGAQQNPPYAPDDPSVGVPLSEPLMAAPLQAAGYRTGAIGKWHLGSHPRFHPQRRGFDFFYGFLHGGHRYWPAEYAEFRKKIDEENPAYAYVTPLERNGTPVEETGYLTDILTREAVQFIETTQEDQPFFLYLAYNAPHVPMEAKPEDLEALAGIEDEDRRIYAAMVLAMDRGVGEVRKALGRTGRLDATWIVFLSDNGGMLRYGASNRPLRGGKNTVFEGGIRVPMFMRPAAADAASMPVGTAVPHTVSALDFYPTFLALAGAPPPEGKVLDGLNLLPHLRAGTDPRKDVPLCISPHHVRVPACRGVRLNDWKALSDRNRPWGLFDLDADLGERNNLAKSQPAKLESLRDYFDAWSAQNMEPRWVVTLP
ncbi:MAG: sulfatase-like hydrolase/transferase [Lentisphaerae bacterium]|nr:sulfatase-like hydrolase/transferase [Lentisphaerota bacterium]